MSNVSSPSIAQEAISLLKPTVTFFIISYTIVFIALVLNFIEISLIVRIWKHATNFELVLLNLAIADVLNCAIFGVVTGIAHYMFVNAHTISNKTKHAFWLVGLHTFCVTASTSFVIVIGVERFFAAKVPLKHRLWHTGRGKILKYVLIMWSFDIMVTGVIFSIDYLINGGGHMVTSKDLAYFMASFLTTGLVLVSILYVWLAHLVLMRSIRLFEFDNKDFVVNAKTIKRAMKKDKAAILVCVLIVIFLLGCNLPLIVDLYARRLTEASVILLKVNPVANPIIYFFKGYLEKYYGKKRVISFYNARYLHQDKGVDKKERGNVRNKTLKTGDLRSGEGQKNQESKIETNH